MARVLIAGGAGYVGSHAAKALAAACHSGVVDDNLSRGHRDLVRWGEFIECEIRHRAGLDRRAPHSSDDSSREFSPSRFSNRLGLAETSMFNFGIADSGCSPVSQ